MSYADFLALLKGNTGNKVVDYKKLCRFCLENQSNGIDISDDNSSSQQQREAILNNYIIITKQYLPISDEYPTFVCSSCERSLSHYALFAQQIEQNAENWEIFLKSGNDVKFKAEEQTDYNGEISSLMPTAIEEIKIEYCDESYNGVPDSIIYDALEQPLLKVELNDDCTVKVKRRRRKATEQKSYMNSSTDFERTCKFCDEPTFKSFNRLYSHTKQKHPGKKIFACDICGATFINKNPLATHMKDRHAKCGKKHQCQFCAKLFYSDREVKGHEKMHVNARSYVCTLCGKGFNTKCRLNMHMKSKAHNADYKTVKAKKKRSKNNSKTVFRCQLCIPSSVFSSLEERTAHRNALHRKFECDICKNMFMAQESLDSHRLLHSEKPRPFVCTICNASFNQSSHLSSHFKRKHTDDKSIQCTFCNKMFFENCDLNAHVNLVHSNQKRVKCSECDCHFASIRYLQKHIQNRHSTEASPYDCKICGKKMGTGALLDLHRLKYHKEEY